MSSSDLTIWTGSGNDEARVYGPLIDVVFLLLVFYVVAATFVQPGGPIHRPSVINPPYQSGEVIITIAADGSWLGDDPWRASDSAACASFPRSSATTRPYCTAMRGCPRTIGQN